MREARKKWIISNVACAILKMAVVVAGLFILSTATGIIEGTLPPVVSVMAIIGAAAVANGCIGAVIKLEGIIAAWERYMRRQRMILARLKRSLTIMSVEEGQRQRRNKKQEASL